MAEAQILVVEDERIIAEHIAQSLQDLGYGVSAVTSSGEEAIRKAEEESPDLVLMDIVLTGEINGIEAAGQIRSRFNIPVIYLTAYADEKTVERAKITGAFGYIIKPFDDRELRTSISNRQRTTGVNPWVNAQIKNLICSLFKCHGREPVGIY